MSSTVLHELQRWDQPPSSHTGLRSWEPVFLLDRRVYWNNKKGIETLYQLGAGIDAATEEQLEELIATLSSILATVDGYLKLRGTESGTLRRIRAQRCTIVDAIECLKRGYAPGKMPPVEDRLELANKRLQEAGHA